MREQTNVLAAEFHTLTRSDPDTSFRIAEPETDEPTRRTVDGRDVEEVRKSWGMGPDAAAGLAAAMAVNK